MNKAERNKRIRAYNLAHRAEIYANCKDKRQRNRDYIIDYKKSHPCVDCGETDWVVLDFDHRPGVSKVADVNTLVNSSYSLEKIKTEIEKCEVRCANDHRRRTAKEQGWPI